VRDDELWLWAPLYPETQHCLGRQYTRSAFKVATIADAQTIANNFSDSGFLRDYVSGIAAVHAAFASLPLEARESLGREFASFDYCCAEETVLRYESLRRSAVVATTAPPPSSKLLAFEADMANLVARADESQRAIEHLRRPRKTTR
jgi:hypothetical protein